MLKTAVALPVPSHGVFTITCNRDRWCFERQYRSMIALCLPTDWWIFVNERDTTSWHTWYERYIQPLGTGKLRVHVLDQTDLTHSDLINQYPGYWRQQFFKLWLAHEIDRDFVVILDSKNWLVKPWHPLMHRMPLRTEIKKDCEHFLSTEILCKQKGINSSKLFRNLMPPVAWEPKHVRELLQFWGGIPDLLNDIERFYEFKNEGTKENKKLEPTNNKNFSEFMLYDLWQQHNNHQDILPEEGNINSIQNICIAWDFEDFYWEGLSNHLSESQHYWFTIKWHHYDGTEDLADKIWEVVEQQSKKSTGHWS